MTNMSGTSNLSTIPVRTALTNVTWSQEPTVEGEPMNNYYWHFAHCDNNGAARLNYGDGREIRLGETLTVEGEPVLCERGLHASARVSDALKYCAYTACLCMVELSGTVIHGDDKSVATERTVIAMLSAEQTDALLREFGRWCALSVAHLWEMPDVVRQYLETGDESLRDAAWAAAWDAQNEWLERRAMEMLEARND